MNYWKTAKIEKKFVFNFSIEQVLLLVNDKNQQDADNDAMGVGWFEVKKKCERFTKSYISVAEITVEFKPKNRKLWITSQSWNKIKTRTDMKTKMENQKD